MYKQFFALLFFLSLFSAMKIDAQDLKKPKVAVVLSGGGAKGIAHIPLLQKLDSLGIVPDLIVGTSMGSLVGGFYAMGYSADSIAAISKRANWNELLGGKIALKDVSIEEKSEFGKYLVDFDVKDGKLKTSSSLLNDQYLREFFSRYTYPAHKIVDFDNLPIPFRAITTDIINGEEVVLKSGSLPVAMRASMSIPSVFKPVPYKDVLLIDGGILNNFPVDVAKKWGADIIIGSDVGGGMVGKEKLEGITTILFQTSMLISNKKNPESRKMCDILIDHLPNLTHDTGDFQKGEEIYKEGFIATNDKLNELVKLSEKLKRFKQKKLAIPLIDNKITLDTVLYKGISKENLDLVISRANIEPHKKYSIDELIQSVNRAMGTTLFKQITSDFTDENSLLGYELKGEENAKNQVKTSLHFDSYRGVGLIANYTGRNILGNSSRIILTADIAEQPRFRVQYQKQLGKTKSWWWRNEVLGEFLSQEVYINGDFADELYYRYYSFDNEFNRNLNSLKSYAGIGFNFNKSILKPKANPDISANVLVLKEYRLNYFEVDAHYIYNTLNSVFFANKGELFKAKVSRSLFNDVSAEFAEQSIDKVAGSTNGFTKLMLSYENRLSLNEKSTLILNADANFIFEDKLKVNEVSFDGYGFGAKYFLGGNLVSSREGSFVFPGLRENEIAVNQFIKFNLRYQYNLSNGVYLTPHVNYASVGFEGFKTFMKEAFLPDGKWTAQYQTSSLFSLGTTASYDSYLGPVNFDISWVNDINKVRLFFSFGLFLTISD